MLTFIEQEMSVVVGVNKQMTHSSVNKTNCDRGNVICLFIYLLADNCKCPQFACY